MLERGEGARAIGVLGTVTAVVEADDVAAARGCCMTWLTCGGLYVRYDWLHAVDQPVVGGGAPVAGEQCPRDDLEIEVRAPQRRAMGCANRKVGGRISVAH